MTQTFITFLLDRSGSMKSILEDTIGGYNAYVDGLRDTDGATYSLLTFDTHGLEKVHTRLPIKDVPVLTKKDFVPRAGTPLIDASMETILAVERAMEGRIDYKVVITILTDGEENESNRYSWEALHGKITEKTAEGWQFMFIGAGIDAYQAGRNMGISAGQTMSYDSSDVASTRSAFSAMSKNTQLYASGEAATMEFTEQQKDEAGDKFAPATAWQPTPPPIPAAPAAVGQYMPLAQVAERKRPGINRIDL
jgi:uncharacterized protein YegL